MSVAVDEETFWLGDWKVEPLLNRIVRGEEIVRTDVRPNHPYVVATRDLPRKALIGLGEYGRAEAIFCENIRLWQQNDGWSRRASANANALGEALSEHGRIDEAQQYLSRASLVMMMDLLVAKPNSAFESPGRDSTLKLRLSHLSTRSTATGGTGSQ